MDIILEQNDFDVHNRDVEFRTSVLWVMIVVVSFQVFNVQMSEVGGTAMVTPPNAIVLVYYSWLV